MRSSVQITKQIRLNMKKRNDLSKRLFNFAVRVIKFLRTLLKSVAEYNVIRYQLVVHKPTTEILNIKIKPQKQ